MSTPAQEEFRDRAKIALIRRRMTIATLARRIRRHRNTVSQAINHGLHKDTLRRVKEALAL